MMKTILKLIIPSNIPISLLFILSINVHAQENGQWQLLNEGGSFKTIDFINEDIGWIAGNGTLLKTEDGGEAWLSLSIEENYDIQMIDFISDSVGWAISLRLIQKSQDGGLTWTIQKEFTDYQLRAIHVVNDSIVYVIGYWDQNHSLGKIFKTSDGGINWIDVSPNLFQRKYDSLCFLNSDSGIVSGCYNYVDTTGSIVIRTVNGGSTWNEIIISEFTKITDLQFINDSTGYFLATKEDKRNTEYFLCATKDMFNTWSIITQINYPIYSYIVLDNQIFFAVMNDSTSDSILKSTDGGLTWENKKRIFGWSYKIFSNNSDVAFLIGFRGRDFSFLLKTTDGGDTWSYQIFSDPLNDIWFFNSQRGLACAGWEWCFMHGGCNIGGHLLLTTDGGKTWAHRSEYMDTKITSCLFVNDDVGFTLGTNNTDLNRQFRHLINKTTDRGMNWITVFNSYRFFVDTLDYTFTGNEMCFTNEQMGWTVGRSSWAEDSSGAGILGTKDGGENWDLIWKYPDTDVYDYSLYSIHGINKTAWAVGEGGIIVKYTEQNQWQLQTSYTDLPLNDVFFSDENHGLIVGGYFDEDNMQLIILKTTDGGETWEEKRDLRYQINDMYFADSLHGWVVGTDTSYQGLILETIDGGDYWTVQVDGLNAPLTALHFRDGYGWAVGENGLVLKTDGINWINQNTGKIYPNQFRLSQNYPNPFNPITMINYQLPIKSEVEISIYNLLGQKIATLVDKKQNAGTHQVKWDATNFASGIYYYRLEAGEFQEVKKMILLR